MKWVKLFQNTRSELKGNHTEYWCCSTRFDFSRWEKFISSKRGTYLARRSVASDIMGLDFSLKIWFRDVRLQKMLHMPPCMSGRFTERVCSHQLCFASLLSYGREPKRTITLGQTCISFIKNLRLKMTRYQHVFIPNGSNTSICNYSSCCLGVIKKFKL